VSSFVRAEQFNGQRAILQGSSLRGDRPAAGI